MWRNGVIVANRRGKDWTARIAGCIFQGAKGSVRGCNGKRGEIKGVIGGNWAKRVAGLIIQVMFAGIR